ncbi:UPF0149 family protein [Microbulbifer halophilus]|uniref:UPF0149 family protein n=1 Tax=Microbulbifer halophilus TaxID=453963 RepID=A0ABW5E7B2_9GAMM|nr:UPF0149 family protein [Microbulbifer halophilus]MCW8126749.1 UPF0149 family protein [Microbulbifer halophilus]
MTAPANQFDSLADAILAAGGTTDPSELHGFACGVVAAGARPDKNRWEKELAELMQLDAIPAELNRDFQKLADDSLRQLRDSQFDFRLLLPGDAGLEAKTSTLGNWCQGFLLGFGIGDFQGEMPATSREALEDIGTIAQVDAGTIEESDETENHLLQVEEYVRVAVMNIFTECSGDRNIADDSGPTLH